MPGLEVLKRVSAIHEDGRPSRSGSSEPSGRGNFLQLGHGFDFTEAPLFDAHTGGVLFSDVRAGGVWECGTDGTTKEVLPHRRGIGGMVVNDDGAIVVGGRNVAAKTREGQTTYLFEPSKTDHALFGFNGMCADDVGRIYVGGLAWDPFLSSSGSAPGGMPGGIFVIDRDGAQRLAFADVVLPNGIAYDEERSILYVCDSERRCVVALKRSVDGTLELDGRIDLDGVKPDGMALGGDGSLFIACVEIGIVLVVSAEGAVLDRISTPVKAVTSVCFAFEELNLLCITGGELERSDAGGLWSADVGRSGARRHMSRIELSKVS
jgi:gluconolactonase